MFMRTWWLMMMDSGLRLRWSILTESWRKWRPSLSYDFQISKGGGFGKFGGRLFFRHLQQPVLDLHVEHLVVPDVGGDGGGHVLVPPQNVGQTSVHWEKNRVLNCQNSENALRKEVAEKLHSTNPPKGAQTLTYRCDVQSGKKKCLTPLFRIFAVTFAGWKFVC